MREFLTWIEASALGHLMRESGIWTYALVNLSHILGVSAFFGSIVILDLRLLGCWRRTPLAALSAAAVPVATSGFVVAVLTGAGLLATRASEYYGNPFFNVKFPAILLGLINVGVLNLSRAWRARGTRDLSPREERQLAIMGGISLICWLTAVTCGRMIGYI